MMANEGVVPRRSCHRTIGPTGTPSGPTGTMDEYWEQTPIEPTDAAVAGAARVRERKGGLDLFPQVTGVLGDRLAPHDGLEGAGRRRLDRSVTVDEHGLHIGGADVDAHCGGHGPSP